MLLEKFQQEQLQVIWKMIMTLDQSLIETNELEKERFLHDIKIIFPDAILNIFYAPPLSQDVPPSWTEVAEAIQIELPNGTPESLLVEFAWRSFNDCQISELEKVTRSQATSNTWVNQRKGRITASNFHDVYTKINSKLRSGGKHVNVLSLLQNLLNPRDISHCPR